MQSGLQGISSNLLLWSSNDSSVVMRTWSGRGKPTRYSYCAKPWKKKRVSRDLESWCSRADTSPSNQANPPTSSPPLRASSLSLVWSSHLSLPPRFSPLSLSLLLPSHYSFSSHFSPLPPSPHTWVRNLSDPPRHCPSLCFYVCVPLLPS